LIILHHTIPSLTHIDKSVYNNYIKKIQKSFEDVDYEYTIKHIFTNSNKNILKIKLLYPTNKDLKTTLSSLEKYNEFKRKIKILKILNI